MKTTHFFIILIISKFIWADMNFNTGLGKVFKPDSELVYTNTVPVYGEYLFSEHPSVRTWSVNWFTEREILNGENVKMLIMYGGLGWNIKQEFGCLSDIWFWHAEDLYWSPLIMGVEDYAVNRTSTETHPGCRIRSSPLTYNGTQYIYGGITMSNDTLNEHIVDNSLWSFSFDEFHSTISFVKHSLAREKPSLRVDNFLITFIGIPKVIFAGGMNVTHRKYDMWIFDFDEFEFSKIDTLFPYDTRKCLGWGVVFGNNSLITYFYDLTTNRMNGFNVYNNTWIGDYDMEYIEYNVLLNKEVESESRIEIFDHNIFIPFVYKESIFFIDVYDRLLFGVYNTSIVKDRNKFTVYPIVDYNNSLPFDVGQIFIHNTEKEHQMYYWISKDVSKDTYKSTIFKIEYNFCNGTVGRDKRACNQKGNTLSQCSKDDMCYCGAVFWFLDVYSSGSNSCRNYDTFIASLSLGMIWVIMFSIVCFLLYFVVSSLLGYRRKKRQFDDLVVSDLTKPNEELELRSISFSNANNKDKLKTKIGEGTFCNVFDFSHNDQTYAARIIKEEMLDYQMFLQEIQIIGKLNHNNVIRIDYVCTDKPLVGYLMEKCIESVEERMKRKNDALDIKKKIKMLFQVASGMAYLHSKNITHRDLKWDNVLLDENGTCKIIDFGFSEVQKNNEQIEVVENPLGTKYLLAPEVLVEKKFDKKSDVFSFGVMIYQIFHTITINELEANVESVENNVYKFKKLPYDSDYSWLMKLQKRCLREKYKARPDFDEIARIIYTNSDHDVVGKDISNQKRKFVKLEQNKIVKRLKKYHYFDVAQLVLMIIEYAANFVALSFNLFVPHTVSNMTFFIIMCSEFILVAQAVNMILFRFFLSYKVIKRNDAVLNFYLSLLYFLLMFGALILSSLSFSFGYIRSDEVLQNRIVVILSIMGGSWFLSIINFTYQVFVNCDVRYTPAMLSESVEVVKKRNFFIIALLSFILFIEYLCFSISFDLHWLLQPVHFLFRFIFYVPVVYIVFLYHLIDEEKVLIIKTVEDKIVKRFNFLPAVKKYGNYGLGFSFLILCVIYLLLYHSILIFTYLFINIYDPDFALFGKIAFIIYYTLEQIMNWVFFISICVMIIVYFVKVPKEEEKILKMKKQVYLLKTFFFIIAVFCLISFLVYFLFASISILSLLIDQDNWF